MRKFYALILCSLLLGACSHTGHGTAGSTTGKACCEGKEMDCCKDAKAKGKECDKC